MRNRTCAWILGVATIASLSPVADASAQEAAPQRSVVVATPRLDAFGMKPVSNAALASRRAGTLVLNDMKLNGVVAENQAVNVTTGGNIITDGALAGTSGMPTVIQNSGNNVLIQNATIVNVQVK